MSRALEAQAIAAGVRDATLAAFQQAFALVGARLTARLVTVVVWIGVGMAFKLRASHP